MNSDNRFLFTTGKLRDAQLDARKQSEIWFSLLLRLSGAVVKLRLEESRNERAKNVDSVGRVYFGSGGGLVVQSAHYSDSRGNGERLHGNRWSKENGVDSRRLVCRSDHRIRNSGVNHGDRHSAQRKGN